jgi:hypothetical protein
MRAEPPTLSETEASRSGDGAVRCTVSESEANPCESADDADAVFVMVSPGEPVTVAVGTDTGGRD